MKRSLLVVTMLLALAAWMLVPGQTAPAVAATHLAAPTQAHVQAFDKTRFVLHLGFAAYLIHYIYKKYKDGKLGRTHIFTDLKAAAAALLAYHELKVSYDIANGSKSKTLQLIITTLKALMDAVSSAAGKLKKGDTSSLNGVDSQLGSFSTLTSKNGYAFSDQQPSYFHGF